MTPFDIFLFIVTAHVPLLSAAYIINTLLVIKNPDKYGGHHFSMLFTARSLLGLIIISCNFLVHRLPAFSTYSYLFSTHEIHPLFRLCLALTYSLPYLHDAISLHLLHLEFPTENLLVFNTSMSRLHLHFLLSSFLSLFLFLISYFTPLTIFPLEDLSSPFQHAHFFLPHTDFSFFPPSPLPLFALISTVLSLISIGIISDRTLTSPYRNPLSQLGPRVHREDRWIQNLQRIQSNVSCMHFINLIFIVLQLLNLRPGYALHLPAGLFLNGFIVELKVFSTLLMFIYDHTKLPSFLLRILDLCSANNRDE